MDLQLDADQGVPHFRSLLASETQRLEGLCSQWQTYLEEDLLVPEEVRGQMRASIGLAHLLVNQRFKQFSGLVTACEKKCGDKVVTPTDLQGFWEMIYFQVEDVYHKFDLLEELRRNNWVETVITEPKKKPRPAKRVPK